MAVRCCANQRGTSLQCGRVAMQNGYCHAHQAEAAGDEPRETWHVKLRIQASDAAWMHAEAKRRGVPGATLLREAVALYRATKERN